MTVSWDNTLNTLCGGYLDSLRHRYREANNIPADVRKLIDLFFNYIDKEITDGEVFENALKEYADCHGVRDVKCMFEGGLRELPVFFLGREWTELWLLYVGAEAVSPYTEGYSRRSLRSSRVDLHCRNIADALRAFLILRATGFSTLEILHGGRTPDEIKELSFSLRRTEWLTAMIKAGDKTCIGYLAEAMTSENNANRVSYEGFRAIVKSGHRGLLELEGRLLLAARLQEGLRQAIVETMDEGMPESYLYLLKVITDNNLQRFASVKRGLAVTTGFSETAAERITDKFIDLVGRYLGDLNEARKGIVGRDAMEVYTGLWALAFFDVDSIVKPIEDLIRTAPSYRVDAAMLLLCAVQMPELGSRLAALAVRERHSEHDVMAVALSLYPSSSDLAVGMYGESVEIPSLADFYDSRKEAEDDFEILLRLLESVKEKETFYPYVFPWMYAELTRTEVADRLIRIAMLLGSERHIDAAIDFVGILEPYVRTVAVRHLLKAPSTEKQMRFAVQCMSDRSEGVRKEACRIVEVMNAEGRIDSGLLLKMEDALRLKASDMRVSVISILSSLPAGEALASASRLIADRSAQRRLAALEMIRIWIEEDRYAANVQTILPAVRNIKRPTVSEKVLIEGILAAAEKPSCVYNEANGYGLYDPDEAFPVMKLEPESLELDKVMTFSDSSRAKEIITKVMRLIEEHADFEFTDTSGETVRFGNSPRVNRYQYSKEALAKPGMWHDFYEREIGSPADLLRLGFAIGEFDSDSRSFLPLLERLLGRAFHKDSSLDGISSLPYYRQALDICRCLIAGYLDTPWVWSLCVDILTEVAASVAPGEMVRRFKVSPYHYGGRPERYILEVWPFSGMNTMLVQNSLVCDDDLFVRSFAIRYHFYRILGYKACFNPVRPEEYLRMWNMGLISDRLFWHEMLGREASDEMVKSMTGMLPEVLTRYAAMMDDRRLSPEECCLINKAVDRILEIELQRGDMPTEVTRLALKVCVVKGIRHFIGLLAGMGTDKPKCSFWNLGDSKRDVFSWLLHVSCPSATDDAASLMKAAEEAGITHERLVEAALFSPKWLPLVEEALGWPGLESAAYYFIAHTGEYLTESARSHISRYSSIAPGDFADGAFDPAWFHEVYRQLGGRRFEVVYQAAKYISENNSHTRARKLSDAALGILKAKDTAKQIEEKRNKDLVVAYGLIPLGKNRMKDLRSRYDVLNRFLKESCRFGSQRQASEGRAVRLALDNLARTAGFGDATRMKWSLEADFVKEMAEYMVPKEIDGVSVYVGVAEGIPELVAESKGKRLQSIPSRLKKDKYVERLREVYRQLKEQHTRGRSLLESAMVEGSSFTGEEILQLRDNPIIWSMLSRLVLVDQDRAFGFPAADGRALIAYDGVSTGISPEGSLRVAHPYDLLKAGVWSGYQEALFKRRIRQPFRQVFRELYIPTQDELGKSRSLRYAGNQIMPGRTVGVLRSRHWTVDYENGLQKVCFNGNVTAVIYALADWFSPSDIEAPTLEYVSFHDRLTFRDKNIEDIPPVVFSEIMRDVDLAVSVAHAGGVDPETSHSTIEMRKAIVSHSVPLFGLDNVEVIGNFAKVRGALGSYNIHLGSGVIHKEGGSQIVVLPVHSQGRGRMFLPFLDEDPKTAEILSKILLFADDTGIKDPSILRQL